MTNINSNLIQILILTPKFNLESQNAPSLRGDLKNVPTRQGVPTPNKNVPTITKNKHTNTANRRSNHLYTNHKTKP